MVKLRQLVAVLDFHPCIVHKAAEFTCFAILIRAFSNQKATDILEANTDFIDEIGLKEHLSPTRANGLVSMIKQIKMYALAFSNKN